ncbi:MAG: hypothetical protein IPM16_16840 [Chloroflexi bacterium]|nr:hypothetical protein [Chloroflexota bacterium]
MIVFPYTLTGDAPAELISAIECGNANGTADVIDLNGQTIVLTEAYADYDGATGLPEITTAITLQNGTIERLDSDNYFRLLAVSKSGDLTLQGVTVQGGWVDTSGAGVYSLGALSLIDSTFHFNITLGDEYLEGSGGGVHSAGSLYAIDSVFSENHGGLGGALLIADGSTATLTNLVITGNHGVLGGGIHNLGNLTVTAATITGNLAIEGGGVYNDGLLNMATSTISANQVSDGAAGLNNTGTATLSDVTIAENQAYAPYVSGYCGGVQNLGVLTMTRGAIVGNSAGGGGGVCSYTEGAFTTLTGTLIAGNSAETSGGALSTLESTLVVLNNVTVSGNYAGFQGGGLYNIYGSPIELNNSIVYGNEAGEYADIGGAFTATNSLVGVDPLFVAPEPASSAPTTGGNYRLLAGSPAIDAGDNALVPIYLTTDLDGNPRIVDGIVDIGAYEVQPVELLSNGGFEAGSAPWVIVTPGGDKVKDKNPYEGTFAFRFKGFAGKTSGKAKQTVDNPPIADGESFVLTAQINSGASAVGKVTLKANTDLGNKIKQKINFDQAGAYSQHQIVVPVTLAVGETVTKVTVIFNDKSQSGKVHVDAVSLTIEPTAPRTVTRSDVLPPPAAPSGFRGGN